MLFSANPVYVIIFIVLLKLLILNCYNHYILLQFGVEWRIKYGVE